MATDQLTRLAEVMARLRAECPWDRQQTHESLVTYLIEETGEVVDAIEVGSPSDLREELGDLLLQVYFHSQIADEDGWFTLQDVAAGICDKLVARHPHVFAGAEAPADMGGAWEARKRAEKGRTSALDGIANSLSSLARAQKVVSRTRSHRVGVPMADAPITAEQVGTQILTLVQRAQASGIDADQAVRTALRALEQQIDQAQTDQAQTADAQTSRTPDTEPQSTPASIGGQQ